MTRRRDIALALGLAVVLVAVGLASLLAQSPAEPPDHSAISTTSKGAGALAEWLTVLGYEVVTEPQTQFEQPAPDEILVMLEPAFAVTEAEWRTLERGLRDAGGRVLIVGDGLVAGVVFGHFGYRLGPQAHSVQAVLPVLTAPAFTRVLTDTAVLQGERADAAPVLSVGDDLAAVTFPLGRGSVTLATPIAAFTNDGLRDPDLARLALNLITATAPERVRFDEWHLGRRTVTATPSSDVIGPEAWLLRTSAGRGLLFLIVLTVIGLWLHGRPFGRPVPPMIKRARRAPMEYVDALARLAQRAGHRQAAADDYRLRIKRQLGQRYRIDPGLTDADFLNYLNAVRPGAPDSELERLLERLSAPQNDAELLRLAELAARRLNEETLHP